MDSNVGLARIAISQHPHVGDGAETLETSIKDAT